MRAEAPGNVIVDLLTDDRRYDWPGPVRIALLPGSRERAYGDAERIAEIVERVAARVPGVAAVLSIAPALEAARFAPLFERHPALGAWSGGIGGILAGATLAIGQAGTANEAAAASGVPVVALELAGDRRSGWYRMRQERLLADAMLVVPGEPAAAADAIVALLERSRTARAHGRRRTRTDGAGRRRRRDRARRRRARGARSAHERPPTAPSWRAIVFMYVAIPLYGTFEVFDPSRPPIPALVVAAGRDRDRARDAGRRRDLHLGRVPAAGAAAHRARADAGRGRDRARPRCSASIR